MKCAQIFVILAVNKYFSSHHITDFFIFLRVRAHGFLLAENPEGSNGKQTIKFLMF